MSAPEPPAKRPRTGETEMTTFESTLKAQTVAIETECRQNYEQYEPLLTRVQSVLGRLDAQVRTGWTAAGIDLTGWEHGVRVGIYGTGAMTANPHRPVLCVVASNDTGRAEFGPGATDAEIETELREFFAYFRSEAEVA